MIKELRALLMEAREISKDALESNVVGIDDPDFFCDCKGCERLRGLVSRIDAALAEQGDVDQDSFMLGANKMRTEIFWMLSSRYGRFGISETLQCAMEVRALELPKDGE